MGCLAVYHIAVFIVASCVATAKAQSADGATVD